MNRESNKIESGVTNHKTRMIKLLLKVKREKRTVNRKNSSHENRLTIHEQNDIT